MKKQIFFLFTLACFYSQAQTFVAPVNEIIPNTPCEAWLDDGSTLKGVIRGATFFGGELKIVNILTENGEKLKIKASKILTIQVKMNAFSRMSALNNNSSSVSEISNTDVKEIWEREYVQYDQVKMPNGKYALLQLINPGFSEIIKVYRDSDANQTATISVDNIAIAGGQDRSFNVVKADQPMITVRKLKYEEYWAKLFGDCRELVQLTKNAEFFNFANDVYRYQSLCSGDK